MVLSYLNSMQVVYVMYVDRWLLNTTFLTTYKPAISAGVEAMVDQLSTVTRLVDSIFKSHPAEEYIFPFHTGSVMPR